MQIKQIRNILSVAADLWQKKIQSGLKGAEVRIEIQMLDQTELKL